MLEEHGYAAGRLERNRVREWRPAAGTRRSEERRVRFETVLRSIGGASMARAGARANEHLAQRAQANVEAAAVPVPRPAEGTAASSSGLRPPGEPEGRSEPAFSGVGSAGAEARAAGASEQMSGVGEPE
eukprot:4332148-Alexandrium_andersonii.AAC.1